MKKTRRALSIVLSLLLVFTSMPMMHIVSTAAGTVDNPTTSVKESDPFEYTDLYKLNIKHSNNNFFFYQTVDDEYFVVKQDLFLQQYTVSLGSNRTLTFHGIDFYTGGSNAAESTDTAGIVEQPTITTNPTSDFMTNYYVSDSWVSTHTNTAGLDCTGDVSLHASGYDLNGKHMEYTWQHSIVFKGHSAATSGQFSTGYYERATWDWDDGEGNAASMDFRIKTSITVVDARDFAEALAHAQNVVANPGNYSAAYVSAMQATLDNIPADLKNFSGYYSQSIVDTFTNSITSIPEDVADYTEFNRLLAECRALTNDNGTYSAKSYAAYVEQIESINAGLPKNLYASQQATVDDAVQALKNAKDLLVVEFPGTGSTTSSDIEDVSPWVENEFNFIQIEDDQVLAFTQDWTIYRGSKSSNRMFYITLDTTDANTATFAPHFTTDCVTTVPSITSGAFEGTLSNQMIFTNWLEVDANGNPDSAPEAIVDGLINPDYAGFQNGVTYYFQNALSFKGMSASETGAKTYTYVQKFYVNWTSWSFGTVNHYNSTTYTTTLNITDARALVEEYNKAVNALNNPGLHSAGYVTELQKIVDSVPQDMVNGTKYYTQAEVDAYYQEFAVLSESLADYSALDAAYERIEAILANPEAYSGSTIAAAQQAKAQADAFNRSLNDSVSNRQLIADMAATLNSVADNAEARADYSTYNEYLSIAHSMRPTDYTGDAYREFMEAVESVESTLPMDLGTSQQATVDDACNTLLNAYLKLTGGGNTNPDSVGPAFTQDAITGEYTNGVIKFTLDYSEYNFTQTKNDEKLSIKTTLTISSADSTKTVVLKALNISSLDSSELANLDTSGNCYNSDSVTINNAENLFIKNNLQYNVVQGVDLLLDANGEQYADTNGDMAWFNTWQNTAGVALSTDGLINDATTLTTEDSSAQAEFVFASAGGGDLETKTRSYTYVLRLAWTEDGVEHHAHLPVTFNISDARDLRTTYYSYMDFINAGNDGTYTDASFQAAADIMASVNTDIVDGNGYYTQDQINAEREKLNNALLSLQAKANYSEFDNAKAQVEALVNAPADTYTDATITAAQNALAEVATLNRDLSTNDQAVVDEATQKLLDVLNAAQEKVDYTDFDAAKDALEDIVNAPEGTYTEETVQNAQNALDEANKIDTDLPTDENGVNQGIVDDATQSMQDVINSAKEKADYTDYNDAKAEADSIVNDDGNGNTIYDEDAFNAYKETVENIDNNLNKDLSTDDQAVVDEATKGLNDAKTGLENNKKADYEEFNQLKDILEQIVNAPEGTYTEESVKNAQDALDAANQVPSDMVVGENNANQDIIDEATQNMKDVIDTVRERADYTDFDAAKDALEEIVNAPEGTYTEETVQNAQNALDEANKIGTDLPADENGVNQGIIDDATQNMQDVINSAKEKADYTDYNNAKAEADATTNDDNAYDQNAFDAYKEAVENIDSALNKDLSSDDQAVVDEATNALADAKATLENNKYADYTDFNAAKDALEEIVNAPAGTYTDETVQKAQEALDTANQIPDGLVVGENNANQNIIDNATSAMEQVVANAQTKADYTDYNNAKSEADAIVNDDGNGNPIYNEDAFNAYKEAVENVDNALNKDLPASQQTVVDEATKALEDAKAALENNKLADYTDFDAAKDALEEIVNAPEGTYTEETVKNAQNALDAANQIPSDMVVGENNANQDIIDEATKNMQDVIDSAEKKADYTDFDKAVEDLENIVNAPEGTYTDETVKNAQDALDSVAGVDKDLPETEQDALDEITSGLQDVINSAKEKADYTDYNNAKNEADNLVNDDGNGNPIYNEDAFNAYKEAVENIDNALNKDLSSDDQAVVDEATKALEELKVQLEESKYYTVTYLDADGNEIGTERFVAGALFGSLNVPALPENTDAFAYVGWISEGALVSADQVLSGDITVKVAREDKVLNLNDDALSIHTATGYITSEKRDMTVAEFMAMFANDADCLEVRDLEGNVLASDDLVGTGVTITLNSKYTDAVYETRTVVVYGDVNGDGLVDADDYAAAKLANIIPGTYTEANYYFFVANDVTPDGYIDALDSAYINLMVKGYK